MMEIENDTKKNQEQLFKKFKKVLLIKDSLLRPSLVGVSKKTEKKDEKNEENKENLKNK